MKKVNVNLGSDSYDINIGPGLLGQVGRQITALGFRNKAVILTDTVVKELYGEAVEQSLIESGLQVTTLVVPPGEEQKSLDTAAGLYNRLCDVYIERLTPVLALGGGVVGDLAGFVAATYLRGVPLVQIPTTLLAQVDSSIGGKVAVDHNKLKNMIGAFYQPRLVLADISVVKSLDSRQVSDGLAEVIKYAVIKDAAFFAYLDKNMARIGAFDEGVLEDVICRSAQIKAGIVEQDEKDLDLRQLLNFGHTVGHAIESVSDFKVGHGEGVALGMIAAGKISCKAGLLQRGELDRLIALIRKARLPVELPAIAIPEIIQAIKHDKKMSQGKVKFVLIRSIGDGIISQDVSLATIEQVLMGWNQP